MSITKREVVAFLSGMTPLELSELVRELEKQWQVSAMRPVAPPTPIEPPRTEPTEYEVVLVAVGEQRLAVVRALRQHIPGLDLRSARDLVDELPATAQGGLDRDGADALAAALHDAGAQIEVRGH